MSKAPSPANERALAEEQIAYYRARAGEYDEWFARTGRYDRGAAHRRAWQLAVSEVEAALSRARPRGRVLEIASGTGIWTRKLLDGAERLTAVDASPEVLEIARRKIEAADPARAARVRFVVADLFSWTPPERYDFVFFGFWLSHVPPGRFERFWSLVERALAPGGRVFFVDSAFTAASTARDHRIDRSGAVERRLNDGRSFRIVKVFHEPRELEIRLAGLGWQGRVERAAPFFLYATLEREDGVADSRRGPPSASGPV